MVDNNDPVSKDGVEMLESPCVIIGGVVPTGVTDMVSSLCGATTSVDVLLEASEVIS